MAMGGSPRGTVLSEINVTPLVDVMLVLLIIFMVTAPLIQQGVDVDLPKARAQNLEADEKKLVLHIDRQRRVYLGKTFIPFSQLETKLATNAKLQTEKELYLRADRGLPYGLVVKVMAMAKLAGIDRVGMITDSADGPDVAAESEAGLSTDSIDPGSAAGGGGGGAAEAAAGSAAASGAASTSKKQGAGAPP